MSADRRIPVLYLAPWVDFGGSDKGTIDWFKWLDKERFRASLITTQPSTNRRVAEVLPHADEVWALPELMGGHSMPQFIVDFIVSRRVQLVHVMNSRLGFELLPDLAGLADPPALVVQLHVEEEDRSGYVRMVTTRYGNLVDAFSVTSEHLADVVEGYDVRRDRIAVIPTGVDVEVEYRPDRVAPQELGPGPHVLYAGRLTEQKDPLLMVEVAAAVLEQRPDARFHVVGDGELGDAVRAAVAARGLAKSVSFHPPSAELAPWYAASDVLLMTSRYEGVPYVLYEAMAMELPAVVPDLPGNAELLARGGGVLVSPRDEAAAYAREVVSLLDANGAAADVGRAARARVCEDRTVAHMAAAHAELYATLLARRATRPPPRAPTPLPPVSRLPARPRGGGATVTVVVPCFDHGRFLEQALASVRAQDHPDLQVVVVDDASRDPRTVALLDRLEQEPDLEVVRLGTNGGPSAARNAGVARARGRYVLPLDADNVLLPGAITALVAQLEAAGEQIGFVYPNLQFFGNRQDYFEAPDYDLHALRAANFCDTCSLLDRSVFDLGFRFPEDIHHGHEDWDFFLTLGTHGIHGEPARQPTLRFRKSGFTRSDTVEYAAVPFATALRERHPALYPSDVDGVDDAAAHRQEAALKARWQPAISVLLLEDVEVASDAGELLLTAISGQVLCDVEVIAAFDRPVAVDQPGPHLRRLVPDGTDRLTASMAMSRGNLVVVVQHGAADLLRPPGFCERLVQARRDADAAEGIAFAHGGPGPERLPFDVIDPRQAGPPSAIALFDRYDLPARALTTERGETEVAALVALVEASRVLQWRHAVGGRAPAPASAPVRHDLGPPALRSARDRAERVLRRHSQPARVADAAVARWKQSPFPAWTPPETVVLIRHKEVGGERRVVTFGGMPPSGYAVEHWLGAVQRFSPPGTSRLEAVVDPTGHQTAFRTVDPSTQEPFSEEVEQLGHTEHAAFPLLQALHSARVDTTGELTLVAGANDVLDGRATLVDFLGFVEAFPNLPAAPRFRRQEDGRHPMLLRGLAARRHVHGTELAPDVRVVGHLGRLDRTSSDGSIAVRLLADGTLVTDRYRPASLRPGVPQRARWAAAPLGWRGQGALLPRARSTARRLSQAAARPDPPAPATPDGTLLGHLLGSPGERRLELFSAIHPVTGDQLLTPFVLEATDLGYGDVTSLGFLRGTLDDVHLERYSVPWASRFGLDARRW